MPRAPQNCAESYSQAARPRRSDRQALVDIAHRLLKIDFVVFLRRRDTGESPRSKAPIRGFDFVTIYEFHKAGNVAQLSMWKPLLQPHDVPVNIRRSLELLDRRLAVVVELPDAA